MGDFQCFDRNLISGSVKTWAGPFRRPTVIEIPAQFFFTSLVDKDDRTVFPFRLTPLQRNVGVFVKPRQFVGRKLFEIALTVLDGVLRRIETGGLTKSSPLNTANFYPEVKPTIWINPISSSHFTFLLLSYLF